jgi:hypothetical protein
VSHPSPSLIRALIVATVVFAVGLLFAFASEPRRVGDGVEYWAMATQLAAGRLPAPTASELADLVARAKKVGHGFDRAPLVFPDLVGADGRQDFPHLWLYPAAVAPALALMTLLGLHPAWAFTATNLLLLATAWAVATRRGSVAHVALVLAGPITWWIDKAHGDVFTVSLLAVACALWAESPASALVVAAPAAAQNPALMPVWTAWALTAAWRVRADPMARHRVLAASFAGGAIVALPLAYYRWHLGVWSPLMHYVHPGLPSVRAIFTLLADPNIGLLPNAPFACIGAVVLGASAWRRDGSQFVPWTTWLAAAAAGALLLSGFAQSVNLNHGATPGMNRWTLWLLPLALLFARHDIQDASTRPRRNRLIIMLAVANVAWGGWFFRPSIPEMYRYPTRLAAWLWTVAPRVYQPAPEIFAERASHREPAPVPTAWPGCTIVLIEDGSWPVSCVPASPTPPACRGVGRLCYAVPASSAAGATGSAPATFTVLGPAAFPRAAAHGWPADAPFVAMLRARLAVIGGDLVAAPDLVRATQAVGWATAWSSGTRVAIYVEQVSPGASLRVRVDDDYAGEVFDLDRSIVLAAVTVPRSGAAPSVIPVDRPLQHGLVTLTRR